MKERKIICVACPRGCPVTVTMEDDGTITSITGNTCKRGDEYARAEVTHPERSLTSPASPALPFRRNCCLRP